MVTSKRHHYLPQFYLKGFTDDKNEFYIFDKKSETIRKSTPLNSFFENHRNTASIKDERFSLLEEVYAHFDGQIAAQLNKIRKSKQDNFNLEVETLQRIKTFIAQMYWRVPESDHEIEILIDRLSFIETGFDIKDKEGNPATKELQDLLKSSDLFRKMYRIFIPFMTSHNEIKTSHDDWKVYFRKDKYNLTGDSPLVIKDFIDFSSLNEELFFPLSSNQMIVHTTAPKPRELPRQFVLMMDLLIIQQSTRFVCCADKEYLEFLIKNFYSIAKGQDVNEQIKENLFSYFR